MTTTITGKNQVTLPAELVRALDWKAGMRLRWTIQEDHSLLAQPVPSRGDIARKVKGLATAKPDSDPVADLQRLQEEDDHAR